MKNRYSYIVSVAACIIMASSGCSWDDSVYKRYVGEEGGIITCTGVCQISNDIQIKEEACKSSEAQWIDQSRCINGGTNENIYHDDDTLITSKTECEALNKKATNKWGTTKDGIEGCLDKNSNLLDGFNDKDSCEKPYVFKQEYFCNVQSENVCKNLKNKMKAKDDQIKWIVFEDKMVELVNGRYIRKFKKGASGKQYFCGLYDVVIGATEGNDKTCKNDDLSLVKDDIENNICAANMPRCVSAYVGKSSELKTLGLCSGCSPDNARCLSTSGIYECFDLKSSNSHCGSCNKACSANEYCSDGVCLKADGCDTTSGNYAMCENDKGTKICTDIKNDHNNCGECGNVCPTDHSCKEGSCKFDCAADTCPADYVYTKDTTIVPKCTNLLNDSENCGACGMVCPENHFCSKGECVFKCGTDTCPSDYHYEIGTSVTPKCTTLKNDIENCGKCGNKCPDNYYCSQGICTNECRETECTVNSSKVCVDTKNNPDHCGKCNNKCKDNEYCKEGNCVIQCSLTECKLTETTSTCVDTMTNPQFCGSECSPCESGQYCSKGKCIKECQLSMCSGECVDISSDKNNCGECGMKCGEEEYCEEVCRSKSKEKCATGQITCYCKESNNSIVCSDNSSDGEFTCISPKEAAYCGITSCADVGKKNGCPEGLSCTQVNNEYTCVCTNGLVKFNDACVSPYSMDHCGATETNNGGNQCDSNTQSCSNGKCVCSNGLSECNEGCFNLLSDAAHCGNCNINCNKKYDNGKNNERCQIGTCLCNDGVARCGDTKCIDVKNNIQFCGAKGECNSTDSSSPNYKGVACNEENHEICNDSGTCVCGAGYVNKDGVCIDPKTDNTYCGIKEDLTLPSDGGNCPETINGICKNGKCECDTGLTYIEAKAKCININTDPTCCGNDCKQCQISSGESCQNGKCKAQDCGTGNINCLGTCMKQSEMHVEVDNQSNYTCKCMVKEGSSVWCPDQNNDPNLGCSSNYTGTDQNCKECGNSCETGHVCKTNSSGFACECPENTTECTYQANTYSNNSSSIAVCQSFSSLNMKSCTECSDNFANVDNDWSNGCEKDLRSDPDNCGTLGNKCSENTYFAHADLFVCNNGVCGFQSCQTGYGNCDSVLSNGCEINLTNNINYCGACNNKCNLKCKNSNTSSDCNKCESGSCCQYDELHKDENNTTKKCCDGYKLYKYSYDWWGGCRSSSHYGCFKSKPDSCWSAVTSN